MNYLKTHDKSTIEEDVTYMIEQLHYRYKDGDFMATIHQEISSSFRREKVRDCGHWTSLTPNEDFYYCYVTKEKSDNLALVVDYVSDSDEHYSNVMASNIDYIFIKAKNIYLSKSRTAKLRLGVKPAKVVREEEEREEEEET